MRPYHTHTLVSGEGAIVVHAAREYLALVDVETYPAFVSRDVDHLDMMAHLASQMRALTAIAWGAPGHTFNTAFFLAKDEHGVRRVTPQHCLTTASGWVRSAGGRLCFTSHPRLFDCAHYRSHAILREEHVPKNARPHVLIVPPGLYDVQVYYHFPFPYGGGSPNVPAPEPKVHFSVVLRHYPLPAPRVAPVRLPGLIPYAKEAAGYPWGGKYAA